MYPVLFQWGNVIIPSYFAVISIAYIFGIVWAFRRALHHELNPRVALDLCLLIMVFGFIGGRMLHVFYEYPEYYLQKPIRVLEIWHGGFVFYGGAILAYFAAFIFLKIKDLDVIEWADLFAPIIPLVYGIGRIASFLSGSCYGTPTNLPWGVVYPVGVEAPPGIRLHPATMYEMLWSFASVLFLLWLERRQKQQKVPFLFRLPGTLFALMLIFHGTGRIMMEHFRGDYRGDLIFGLTISTWVSWAVILIGFSELFFAKLRIGKAQVSER